MNDNVPELIRKAVMAEVELISKEEIKLAQERIEKRVKERTVEIACATLNHFTMERFQNELVIRVKFEANK